MTSFLLGVVVVLEKGGISLGVVKVYGWWCMALLYYQ